MRLRWHILALVVVPAAAFAADLPNLRPYTVTNAQATNTQELVYTARMQYAAMQQMHTENTILYNSMVRELQDIQADNKNHIKAIELRFDRLDFLCQSVAFCLAVLWGMFTWRLVLLAKSQTSFW